MSAAAVKPIPEGMHSLTPHLICAGAAEAIRFYAEAFGAVEQFRLPGPEGKLMHACLKIGDSMLMLVDEMAGCGMLGPRECRCRGRAGGQGRRPRHDARRRHVLGRPLCPARRPVRPPLVRGDASTRCVDGGDAGSRTRDGALMTVPTPEPADTEGVPAGCSQGALTQRFNALRHRTKTCRAPRALRRAWPG
jgi:hypothetical protein